MLKAADLFIEGTQDNGMEPCPGPKFEKWLKEAGFTEVVNERLVFPLGPWAKDKTLVSLPFHIQMSPACISVASAD